MKQHHIGSLYIYKVVGSKGRVYHYIMLYTGISTDTASTHAMVESCHSEEQTQPKTQG